MNIVDITNYLNDTSDPLAQVLMTYGEDKQFDAAYTYGLDRIEVEDLDETRPESQDPLYYLYDGLGSVAYMVKPDGNTRDHYSYDEFGKPAPGNSKLSEDGRINLNNTFGYTGEMWDEEADLLYLRARYYEPETGRFLSRDTYEGELGNPLSRNLYAYVQNNPINAIDPSGHVTLKVTNVKKDVKSLRNDKGINSAYLRDLAETIGAKFTHNELKKYEVVTFKQKDYYFYHDHWWVENGKIRLSVRRFAQTFGLVLSWSGVGAQQVINLYIPNGTPIFSKNGNINTLACHVASSNGALMSQVYMRQADYYSVSYTTGPSVTTTIRDRYGNAYFFKGLSNFGFGGSIRAGYLDIEEATQKEIKSFLQGYGGSGSAGLGFGMARIYSKGNGWATEVAITTPDVSISAGHSWIVYENKT